MKSADTLNFESGLVTTHPQFIDSIMERSDQVWMGKYCRSCKRKTYCSGPIL